MPRNSARVRSRKSLTYELGAEESFGGNGRSALDTGRFFGRWTNKGLSEFGHHRCVRTARKTSIADGGQRPGSRPGMGFGTYRPFQRLGVRTSGVIRDCPASRDQCNIQQYAGRATGWICGPVPALHRRHNTDYCVDRARAASTRLDYSRQGPGNLPERKHRGRVYGRVGCHQPVNFNSTLSLSERSAGGFLRPEPAQNGSGFPTRTPIFISGSGGPRPQELHGVQHSGHCRWALANPTMRWTQPNGSFRVPRS